MKYLYWYKALSGVYMPVIDESKTPPDFGADSTTPVVKTVVLTPDNIEAVRGCLEAQLTATPREQTGLVWNLKYCLRQLRFHGQPHGIHQSG